MGVRERQWREATAQQALHALGTRVARGGLEVFPSSTPGARFWTSGRLFVATEKNSPLGCLSLLWSPVQTRAGILGGRRVVTKTAMGRL